jgi:hypothetical protein
MLPLHKRQGGEKYSSYSFLTSALDWMSGQRRAPTSLYPRERSPRTQWTGGWMGLQSWSAHRRWRKSPLSLPGIEPPLSSL